MKIRLLILASIAVLSLARTDALADDYHVSGFVGVGLGGTWSDCPDPVEFSNVEGINIYKDSNAFYKQFEWGRREPTVNTRETDGSIRLTSEQHEPEGIQAVEISESARASAA